MSFGSPEWQPWILDEAEALPLLEHAYKVGLNTWDTQPSFEWLNTWLTVTGRRLFQRKHILDAVDNSVKRLGTYIDVLQIHRLDRNTPREEIMRALNDVVESGKVRYIGASSMAAWEFQTLQNIAERHGWHKFISMQNYYNLIYREEEREMIPYCKDTGVGLIPVCPRNYTSSPITQLIFDLQWSPVARGVLTRPWGERTTKREQTDNFLKNLIRSKETEIDKNIVDRLEEVAKKHNVSMTTIATAWAISKGVSPIIGLSSKERIDQAVTNAKFELSEEVARYLEEPYAPKAIAGY
ncbi:hypothetical protein LTR04_006319 [Oleoguttula sp. CCFEE 6159]|nr:hypothetical protein LTR04_006319 [Oleoguttula sp. CCFEE 6159]